MKKTAKKLVLAKETVGRLELRDLEHAAAAASGPVNCFTTTNSAGTNCDVCQVTTRVGC